MRYLFSIVFIFVFTFSSTSFALSCFPDRSPKHLLKYDAIIDAVPEKTGNHQTQKFKVEKVYKGAVKKGSSITINQPSNMVSRPSYFKGGENYILFLNVGRKSSEYDYDVCSPSFSKLSAIGTEYSHQSDSEVFAYLETREAGSFNEKIVSYHRLTVDYPHVLYFHDKIANFLVEEKRFDKAVLAYQNALRARHMLSVRSKMGEQYAKNFGATYEEIPFYDSSLGIPINPDWFMIGDRKNIVFPYALALAKSGRQKDALRALEAVRGLMGTESIEEVRAKIMAEN